MRIELFDVDEFIKLNKLREITSPVLFERGGVPNPNGLVSNEIFGYNVKQRKETFAYINLQRPFFHPHVYKAFKRLFSNVVDIVNGTKYYTINSEGELIRDDENGETGLDFIYNNWEKIKWKRTKGMRNERIDLITKTPKDQIFMKQQIVIPAFYRDITSSQGGGGGNSPLNDMYTKIIRLTSLLDSENMFDFSFHGTISSIQNIIVDIYDYFKEKLEGKSGLLRKYLMGKNTEYAVRTVISAPTFHANKPEEMIIDFLHAGLPISQCCVLVYPLVVQWLKAFFDREFINNKTFFRVLNPVTGEMEDTGVELKNPEAYFNDRYIKKAIDRFIRDPESRFDQIELPVEGKRKMYLRFVGRRYNGNNPEDASGLIVRNMTWADLLFMACSDIVKDKHALITRYPLLDYFGMFMTRVRVLSTQETEPMMVNGTIYKWYPKIDLSISKEKVSVSFIDTCQFSNSYLMGIGGDYDGDQVTVKILWTQEANQEAEKVINSKAYLLNINGETCRHTDNEAIQTLYVLTKNPVP